MKLVRGYLMWFSVFRPLKDASLLRILIAGPGHCTVVRSCSGFDWVFLVDGCLRGEEEALGKGGKNIKATSVAVV